MTLSSSIQAVTPGAVVLAPTVNVPVDMRSIGVGAAWVSSRKPSTYSDSAVDVDTSARWLQRVVASRSGTGTVKLTIVVPRRTWTRAANRLTWVPSAVTSSWRAVASRAVVGLTHRAY